MPLFLSVNSMLRLCFFIFILLFSVTSKPFPFAAPFILTFLETSSLVVGRNLITRYLTKKVASGATGFAIGVTSFDGFKKFVEKRAREDLNSPYGRIVNNYSLDEGVYFSDWTGFYGQDVYSRLTTSGWYSYDTDFSGAKPDMLVGCPIYLDSNNEELLSDQNYVNQRHSSIIKPLSIVSCMDYHNSSAEVSYSSEENTRRSLQKATYDTSSNQFIFEYNDYNPYNSHTVVNSGTYKLQLKEFEGELKEEFLNRVLEKSIQDSITQNEIPTNYLHQDNGSLTSDRPHPLLLEESVLSSQRAIEFTSLYEEKLPSGRDIPDFTDSIFRDAATYLANNTRPTNNPDVTYLMDNFYPKIFDITTNSLEDYSPAPSGTSNTNSGTQSGTGTNTGTGENTNSGAQTGTGTSTGAGTNAGTGTNANSGSASIPISQNPPVSQNVPAGSVFNLNVDVSGVERRIDMTNDYLQSLTTAVAPENSLKIVDLNQLKSFWNSSYENGILGVFDDFYDKFKQSDFYSFLDSFRLNFSGAHPPCWDINFDLGFVNFGTQRIEPPDYIWSMIRALLMFTALIFSRRLIFGA